MRAKCLSRDPILPKGNLPLGILPDDVLDLDLVIARIKPAVEIAALKHPDMNIDGFLVEVMLGWPGAEEFVTTCWIPNPELLN